MISHLKSAFKSMVNDSTWMDSETKKIAIDKVNAIREFLAYPDWIKNQTALESYYSGVFNLIYIYIYIYNFLYEYF